MQLDDSDSEVGSTRNEEEIEYYTPTIENITKGKFVLVRFVSGSRKKTEFRYVCMVIELLEKKEVQVQGLKSADSRKVFRIVEDDMSTVPFQDIVAILPDPTFKQISQRIKKYNFTADINIKECYNASTYLDIFLLLYFSYFMFTIISFL